MVEKLKELSAGGVCSVKRSQKVLFVRRSGRGKVGRKRLIGYPWRESGVRRERLQEG